MLQAIPKEEFLAQLRARNQRNREMVEEIFLPLNQAQRSAQPAPGEWSVDQCFQHLVLTREFLVPKFIIAAIFSIILCHTMNCTSIRHSRLWRRMNRALRFRK